MIVNATQLLHFEVVVVGVMDHGRGLSKRHATFDVVDRWEEACAIRDVDHVHFVVLIELGELLCVALQSDLLLRLLMDSLHVHEVVFLVLIVDLIDAGEDLIVITVE